jgi:Domain of unknown function (DUF4823)
MRLVSIVLLMSLLSACTDTHQLLRSGHDKPKLEKSKIVYISVPKDGRYGQTVYSGSGPNTTQIVHMAFSQYVKRVESGHEYQTFEEALNAARKHGAAYLVVPTILEWEDRATEWSGIPDKVSIRISIADTGNSETIDSVVIKGKSGLATFGGDHPQDLLPQPVGEYVMSLFK